MANLRSRNDPVRLLWRRLRLLGLLVIVGFGISGVWSAYNKEQESAALRAQAQAQLQDLQTQQKQLNADITRLESTSGMEAALRQQYALAAKGEDEIIIVDPATSAPAEATSSAFAAWLHNTFPWW